MSKKLKVLVTGAETLPVALPPLTIQGVIKNGKSAPLQKGLDVHKMLDWVHAENTDPIMLKDPLAGKPKLSLEGALEAMGW